MAELDRFTSRSSLLLMGYQGSFVTRALERVLKSGIATLLDAFCLFGIALVIQGLLCFPVNFRGFGGCCFVFLIFLLLGGMSLEF